MADVLVDPSRGFGQPIFARGGARLEDALALFRPGGRSTSSPTSTACPARSSRTLSGSPLASPPDHAAGHPEGLPDLFLDRNFGRRQVPALLRGAGLRLHTLAKVYGVPGEQDVVDTAWLQLGAQRGWPVLMKDERIRYRPAERAALVAYRVQAFCLTGGNLRAAAMLEQYRAVIDDLARACEAAGPFLNAVSARGLRRLDLLSERPRVVRPPRLHAPHDDLPE